MPQNQWDSNLNAGQTDYNQWAANPTSQWGAVPEVDENQKIQSQTDASWGVPPVNNTMPAPISQPSSFDYYSQPKENNQVRF